MTPTFNFLNYHPISYLSASVTHNKQFISAHHSILQYVNNLKMAEVFLTQLQLKALVCRIIFTISSNEQRFYLSARAVQFV